jgi:seryl-tRNA synthetase
MLDHKFIRENPKLVKKALKDRNYKFDLDNFLGHDESFRRQMQAVEKARADLNKITQEIKKQKPNPALIKKAKEKKKKLAEAESHCQEDGIDFKNQLLYIPNIPHKSVPVGDESCNKVIKTKSKLRKFDFTPLPHTGLAEQLDIIDFKRGAKLAGSNFVLFKGDGAKLSRALANFMLDLHTSKDKYKEVSPPALANIASMTTTGQLPKFEDDMYVTKVDDLFLIPTSEVPLTNIHQNEILNETDLPIYYTAYTPCFRREAGSYGKDTKGLVRVHQFDKVELVKLVKPENSYKELENLLEDACQVIELLKIPYRVNLLATQELSFASAKCYDIELYAPGLDKWLEVSSCSNFEDFQARRGKIRYRDKESNKPKLVHTLNGSGVALPRLIVAILENYQQKDGSIMIPEALRRYFDGRERITK